MKPVIDNNRKHLLLHLCIIVLAVLLAYISVFNAGFLSWDDGEYVLHNSTIRGLNSANASAWFTGFFVGNYHPLTMASYALDYAFGGLNPFIYHFSGILLHVANACLVYAFVSKLQSQKTIALAVALIFALHPVQTESVSWIAERKTVLSGLFCLLSMLQYQAYVRRPGLGQMLLLLLFSACAMLSKGLAVALPLSFFAIDIWLERDMKERRIWLEKLPIVAIAILTGIVAIQAQQHGKFLESSGAHPLIETIAYAAYAYVVYIVRFFVPLGLSAMYPYPEQIGVIHYLSLIPAFAIVGLFFWSLRRKWHILSGGILFYTVSILFVLQFISFGEALMADRYMYIACLGLAYPAMYYPAHWLWKRQVSRRFMYLAAIPVLAMLALSFTRNQVWLSDLNFFKALLQRFPDSGVAQYSAGAMYMKTGDYEQAALHLNKAVRLAPGNEKAWHNKGLLSMRQGHAMEALEAFDRSIAINDYPKAHFSRAMLHLSAGRPDRAQADIEVVLSKQPHNARALCILGDCLERTGKLDAAMNKYNQAIEHDAGESLFYVRRGATLCKLKKYDLALPDLNLAIDINASNGEAFYWRGMAKAASGQPPCVDLQLALQRRYSPAKQAIEDFCRNK